VLDYPAREMWPEMTCSDEGLSYPATLNSCYELLDRNLDQGRGSSPAIFFHDSVITYSELHEAVTRAAGGLRRFGIGAGDRVILRLVNRPEFVIAFLAVLRIGAVAVPTAPLLRHRELGAVIQDCEPSLIVSEFALIEEIEKMPFRLVRLVSVESLLSGTPFRECAPCRADDLAILLYTSGSTGVPKGCMHSHANLLAVADTYAREILQPDQNDRFGGHPTMAFAYGLGGLLLFPLRFGAASVLMNRFTAPAMIATIRTHRVTLAFCTPTSIKMMMRDCAVQESDVSSLRYAISAGETLPAAVYSRWREQAGVEILDGLGSTEMLHIFISSRGGRSKAGATGEVVPQYRAAVVDEKTLEPVPDGTPGLLAVRGPTGCRYLRLPDRQQDYVRNGWNIPGDIYIRDNEGYFHYQCRNDELIVCGGSKIAGPEIEAVLAEHPAVAEVAVVASPDALRGMVPKAFIVLDARHQPTEELKSELQEFVQGQLAPYKYPRRIAFVSDLPKTSTGKIQRTQLRRAEFESDNLQT
jgi:2-aminobenzoate-CoA ligase